MADKLDILCKTLSILLFPEKFEKLTDFLKTNPRLMEFCECRANESILVSIDSNKKIDVTSNFNKIPDLKAQIRAVLIININGKMSQTTVDVTTPLMSLHSTLSIFWQNYLSQYEDNRSKGQDAMETTIKQLGSTLKLKEGQSGSLDASHVANIFTFQDEIEFWGQAMDKQPASEVYTDIVNKFKTLDERLKEASTNTAITVNIEVVDRCFEILKQVSALGEETQPKVRMLTLIDILSQWLIQRESQYFNDYSLNIKTKRKRGDNINWIWDSLFVEAKHHIRQLCSVLTHFMEKLGEFVLILGIEVKDVEMGRFDKFMERVNEIQEIRSQHDLLLSILGQNSADKEQLSKTLEIFGKVKFLNTADLHDRWDEAKKKYNGQILQFLKKSSQKLRYNLFDDSRSVITKISNQEKYKHLLKIDFIANEFKKDREKLCQDIMQQADSLKDEVESLLGMKLEGDDMSANLQQLDCASKFINQLSQVRNFSTSTKRLAYFCEHFMFDCEAGIAAKLHVQKITKEFKGQEDEIFEDWNNWVRKEPDFNIQLGEEILQFEEESGRLQLRFSEKTLLLQRDTLLLGEMGYKVGSDILKITETTSKFHGQAVSLRQIVDYYNAWGAKIMPVQKPLLLGIAVEFENEIIKIKENKITWSNQNMLSKFVDNLHLKYLKISSSTKNVQEFHSKIVALVKCCFGLKQIRDWRKFKEYVNKIEGEFDQLKPYHQEQFLLPYKEQFDMQIYKAMDAVMKTEINAGEIWGDRKIELIFKDDKLDFNPGMYMLVSEIQEIYSEWLEKLVEFKGISGKVSFDSLSKKYPNLANFQNCIADSLGKLRGQINKYKSQGTKMIFLNELLDKGELDLQVEEAESLQSEVFQLPDWDKYDGFHIDIHSFKNSLNVRFATLRATISGKIRERIERFVTETDTFVSKTNDIINKKSESFEEITKSKIELGSINQQLAGINAEYSQVLKANETYKKITNEYVKIEDFKVRLQNLIEAVKDFDARMDEQKNYVKQRLLEKAEDLIKKFDKFTAKFATTKPKKDEFTDMFTVKTIQEEVLAEQQNQEAVKASIEQIQVESRNFEMELHSFPKQEESKAEMDEQFNAWKVFLDVQAKFESFYEDLWLEFPARQGEFEDLITSYLSKVHGKSDIVSKFLVVELNRQKMSIPIFKQMNADCQEKEHWASLLQGILKIDRNITLKALKFKQVAEKLTEVNQGINKIKDLQSRAQGEQQIRESISDIKAWFEVTEFNFQNYKCESGNFNLIKEWKELTMQISDNISLLSSLKESKQQNKQAENISSQDSKMVQLDFAVSKLSILQRKWIYLEPIFARKALPQEEDRFMIVDKEFREQQDQVQENKRVSSIMDLPNIGPNLERLIEQLERCQKALNDFLEEKRSKFPRFYFIGDEDLLEILGQSRNKSVILAHIKKLYEGINQITSDEDFTQVQTINSANDESVALEKPVQVTNIVEDWLNELTEAMKSTLQSQLKELVSNDLDINKYPAQVLMLGEMLNFNSMVQKAIRSNTLIALKDDLATKIEAFTRFRDQGSYLDKLKLKSLILDLIHNIEIVDTLMKDKVSDMNSWGFMRLIRQELKGILRVRMVDALFEYTFEQQGNATKLVHTPLTDKCYLTLTQGMKMGYGGNPQGPAGTGKTESVKALGSFMGRQVLVFNCDEAIDQRSIGRIFVGIIKSGSWGCFDEFNRLLEEQLSAISQQIQTIQAAIKEKQNVVEILGKKSELDFNSGIFVTLNPAGKGYGARSKLPDNLKQLFRPVAMSIPDSILISETLTFAEGFRTAKELAVKIVSLFQLSQQMLSYQKHQDWGLRALKTCLNSAGNMLSQHIKKNGSEYDVVLENEVIIKSLRINTCPKLTNDDAIRQDFLLQDIFPEYEIKDFEMAELEEKLKEVVEQKGLEESKVQFKKIIQFYESLNQRIGVCLVGPSGSGKSTIWNLCKGALEKLGRTVKTFPLNPKAISKNLLLGDQDQDTREFKDGVLTACARKVAAEGKETLCWIVCDGDIDPKWVESLNSVLDDNKLLTLPNGERIQFGPNVNFLFETHLLKQASPATVSRVAVIQLNEQDFDVDNQLKYRFKNMKNQDKAHGHIKEFFMEILRIGKSVRLDQEVISNTQLGFINNLVNLLKLDETSLITDKQEFLCALINGTCLNLKNKAQIDAQEFIKKQVGNQISNKSDKLLNMFVQNGTWTEYKQQMPAEADLAKLLTKQVLVGLPSQMKVQNILKTLLNNGENIILTGSPGSGKSLIISHVLNSVKNSAVVKLSCHAATSALDLIRRLQSASLVVNSVHGKVWKPKDSSKFIIYIQNLNLIDPDQYETIGLVEFLLQVLTYKGFQDENLEFVTIEKLQLVVSMQHPTYHGRNSLSTRFTSRMQVVCLQDISQEECAQLYQALLTAVTAHSKSLREANLPLIGKALSAIQKHLKDKLTHEDQPFQDFSPRLFCNIINSLRNHNATTLNDLILALVFEVDRHIQDRLAEDSHKTELDNCLFPALSKVVGVAPNSRNNLWKYSIVDGNDYTLQGDKAINQAKQVQDQQRLFEREFQEMRGLHLEEEEYLLNFLKIEVQVVKNQGNCTLLTRPGSGFLEAISLVTFFLKKELIRPQITHNYTFKTFLKEVKAVLNKVIIEQQHIVFFVEDHKLIDKDSLQFINSLMEGIDPWLIFTKEEMEPIRTSLADVIKETGLSVEKYIRMVCAQRLKIVMCIDNSNPSRNNQFLKNPGLLTGAQVAIISNWTNNLQQNVAFKKLKDKLPKFEEFAPKLSKALCALISTQEKFPMALEKMLENQVQVLDKQDKQFHDQLEQQQLGLSKLKSAEEKVDSMSRNAETQRKELIVKQEECSRVMKQISEAVTRAAERRQNSQKLESDLVVNQAETIKKKKMIETELADVKPLIDAAKQKVGAIRQQDMNEIKNQKIMPNEIRDVICVIMMFFKDQDAGLTNMKKFLGNRGIITEIVSQEPRLEDDELVRIEEQMTKNARSFQKEVIEFKSAAAVSLAEWAVTSVRQAKVVGKIAPLREELERTEASLEFSKVAINQCKKELDEIDKQVKQLESTQESRTFEASMLKTNLEREEKIVFSAQNLIGKLAGERTRWSVLAEFLEKTITELPQRSIVAAGFLTFLGKEGEHTRNELLDRWHSVLKLESTEMLKFLSDETQNLKCRNEGISGDTLSLENVVNLLNCRSLSFIIDPNNNCLNWLQKHLEVEGANFEITSHTDEKFMTKLELAIRFGRTLIINEMNSIPPVLNPLIKGEVQVNGPRKSIHINDKILDQNDGFCLQMITRDDTIKFDPIQSAQLNVLNFSVTSSGLEDQLLSITIDIEQPDLERRKQELIEKENNLKIKLNELEKSLLTQLTQDDSDILENKELINNLDNTKSKTLEINTSLQESSKVSEDIELQRSNQKNLSIIGARVYLASKELIHLNHMYQFGLNQFFTIYKNVIKNYDSSVNADLKAKIATLVKSLITDSWFYFSRTLFKADRLAFGLHQVNKVNPKNFPDQHYQVILGKMTPSHMNNNKLPKWLPQEKQEDFEYLLNCLPEIASEINFDTHEWREWYLSPDFNYLVPLGNEKLPWKTKISLIKQIKPDLFTNAVAKFVGDFLKVTNMQPPKMTLDKIVKTNTMNAPMLLVTSAGSDPTKEIEECATKSNATFEQVALGGGQSQTAVDKLESCMRTGSWLFLKNIHLGISYLPRIEWMLLNTPMHTNFKLFLTSESHPKFPSTLLQTCLKFSFESPPGIKQNVQSTWQQLSKSFIDNSSSEKVKLVFSLSLFHALVQERRNFIPQGWVKFQEFSQADLITGLEVINVHASDKNIDYELLRGLFLNAIQGGRVDNDFDSVVLEEQLKLAFNEKVNTSVPLIPYLSPPENNVGSVQKQIQALKDYDSPEIFGLPSDVEKNIMRFKTSLIITQMKSIQSLSESNLDKQKISTTIQEFWGTLSKKLEKQEGKSEISNVPMDNWVSIEIERIQNLIKLVNETVKGLVSHARGAANVDNSKIPSFEKLQAGDTPDAWLSLQEGPDNNSKFMNKLCHIASNLNGIKHQIRSSSFSAEMLNIDIENLMSSTSLINALKQTYSRRVKAPLSSVRISFQHSHQAMKVRLRRMQLNGCGINQEQELQPKDVESPDILPINDLSLQFSIADPVNLETDNFINVPVQENEKREDLVMALKVKCKGPINQYILSGTALFVSVDLV